MSTHQLLVHQVRLHQWSFWRNPESAFFSFAMPLGVLLIFGATTGQPPSEHLPRGRGQEDQKGVWHGCPHLPGPLALDLQQDGHTSREPLHYRPSRGPVAVPGELRPLKELPRSERGVEPGVVAEGVVQAIHFSRTGGSGGQRDRLPHLRVSGTQARNNCALADSGRPGQHR